MGMKFLNKKGWHTGSLRNIENVWKAEQKDEAEKRKLDELRKQIAEERERDEFRQLQVEAGFAPRQERLEFLYDSGLSVGKTSSEGFSALQSLPPVPHASNSAPASAAPSSAAVDAAAPGALFEEKPQSANDAWRKLHSDPLLMIRQREQEALAQIKNNPVKMAMIRKSMEAKKKADEAHEGKQKKVKSKHKRRSSSKHQSDTEDDSDDGKERKRNVKYKGKEHLDSDEDSDREKRHRHSQKDHGSEKRRQGSPVKRKPDRHEGRERQELDEDLRERTKDHRHSRRDNGREDGHGSPVKQRTNRNEGRERIDIDGDSRERSKDHRHSGRDHRTERGHESPIKQKTSRNQGRERLDDEERSKDHRHSRRDYENGKNHGSPGKQKADRNDDHEQSRRGNENLKRGKGPSGSRDDNSVVKAIDTGSSYQASYSKHTATPPKHDSFRRRGRAPQLSEEERAARLREMQMDAEVHEEQRWKRLKKAEEEDAREASKAAASASRGKSFLDDAHKSVYGAEKGGSSTIEESVRRRSHYLQGRTQVDEHNAFRR